MKFSALGNTDARIVQSAVHSDERGSFFRSWCASSFVDAGIEFTPVQGNSSTTRCRHTVRGMHFQRAPFADAKIVRCTAGRIHDVIVDLRPRSPTFRQQFAVELAAESGTMLFVPAGFAHGFQTLTDDVIVEYLMGESYHPEYYDGFRHDDAELAIDWPAPAIAVSQRDRSWPDLRPRLHSAGDVA